jgi:dolichol-phosphate mannosyltransferase
LGTTIQDGLDTAIATSAEVIVTMDADETHDPELIPGMVRCVAAGFDVVIASRYVKGSRVEGVPYFRRFLSAGAALLFRMLFPIRGVRDYTSGFRAFKAESLKAALTANRRQLVEERGFQFSAGLLLGLRRLNFRYREVPIILRYDWKRSTSKMNVFRTIGSTFRMMLRWLVA